MATQRSSQQPTFNQPQQAPAPATGLLDSIIEKHNAISAELDKRIDKIEELLPPIMKGQANRLAERAMMTFKRMAEQNKRRRPDSPDLLASLTPADFVRAVLEAAELGLAIDSKLAYVVPFKGKWQMIPDYKGIVAVAKRNRTIKDVYADAVYENDVFKHGRHNGTSILEHSYALGKDRGRMCLGAYAVVILPDGSWRTVVMDFQDLERIRSRSPAGNNGPWITDPNEMRKKTVIKRALKLYCDDPAIARALELEDRLEEGEIAPSTASKVQEALNASRQRANAANGTQAATPTPSPQADFMRDLPISESTIRSIQDEARRQFGERQWANELQSACMTAFDVPALEQLTNDQGEEILVALKGGPEPGVNG